MSTDTRVAVATLATEGVLVEGAEQTSAGPRDVTLARPVGTVLRNDGIRRHWLASGHTYQVTADGEGWRVDSEQWTDRSHVYRLATAADCVLVSALPTQDGGTVALEQGRAYEVLESAPGVWALYIA